MDRRNVLKSAVSVAGQRVLAAGSSFGAQTAAVSRDARSDAGPFITTRDGERLFYQDWGTGAPIVFLAAWALSSAMWDYQTVPLSARGLRCIAYDRRGHGRSSRPGVGYDYDTLADDLAAVVDALDLHDVTLVGMSMAGGEMVRYVTRHGVRRISRLVFLATNATPFRTRTADNPAGIPADELDHFRQNVLLRDYPRWLEDNRQPFFAPDTTPQMQEWIRSMMLGTSLKALVECSRSMAATDFRAELAAIGLPTLLIHGDRDASAPLDLTGRPTAALIPGARLTVYEGAPHGLFVTHMARLNVDLHQFATTR